MSLIDTFRYHSQVLAAKSSALETIHHAGDRGVEREDVLEEFLLPLLPEQIGIGRGEIRASNGQWSKQEDLILYDKLSCPRLFVGSRSQVFPAESVGAVIEVKTRLNTEEIGDATQNIARVRELEKGGMATRVGPGSINFGSPTPILGCVFAYDLDLKPETFKQRWIEVQLALPPQQRINLACVLDRFTIVHIDRTFHLWDSLNNEETLNTVAFFESGKDTLMTFTLCLLRVLAETRFGVPDLFKYYFSGGDSLDFPFQYFGVRKDKEAA
jgi:hypothetical protein